MKCPSPSSKPGMLSGHFVPFVDRWTLTLALGHRASLPLRFILLPVGRTPRSQIHLGPPAAPDTTRSIRDDGGSSSSSSNNDNKNNTNTNTNTNAIAVTIAVATTREPPHENHHMATPLT
ncbi:uncharacterized protein TRIREDRAFT_105894 [Trichoderma reesei QM6a]|uniref:Predicted protein n=2 Tax=Hypocrea jecorina TaxID=51453 RepID=G0RFK9_HYPJQ|nr:uncharacterized protein TRIREDRAFT_105894 [Trichoderma reesei QM6a]EGR49924.1 predicted protein [Trichoderma reesei QM6a]ETS03275.1 hypothetical protein M419DRAFT_34162 [Trichoderma reesei RUT C-30]